MKKSILPIVLSISLSFVVSTLFISCEGAPEQNNSHEHSNHEEEAHEHSNDEEVLHEHSNHEEEAHEHSNHEETAHEHENDSEMTYACPMHPEIKGKEGDHCSKCDMSLEVISDK